MPSLRAEASTQPLDTLPSRSERLRALPVERAVATGEPTGEGVPSTPMGELGKSWQKPYMWLMFRSVYREAEKSSRPKKLKS